jgi:hypothetical protein
MWKLAGVAGLWVSLLAVPHVGPTAIDANFAGAAPPFAVPEDLGDPPPPDAGPAEAPREAPGAFATIHLENELGKTLTLLEAHVTMDGTPLPAVADLAPGDDATVFAGRVAAGHHVVRTRLVCQGNRRGPFTYLRDYKWEVASDEVLTVPDDEAVVFTIAATRKKGLNVPFERQVGITLRDYVVPRPAP